MDKHLYEMEFPGEEMTELTAKIIVESMCIGLILTGMKSYCWKNLVIAKIMVQF